jgi:CubicO group peptidase (beta-lactamase class C family)
MATGKQWVARTLITLVSLVVVLVAVAFGVALYLHIPQNAAGLAAKTVCSTHFVAGRNDDAATLMAQDVLPASPALGVVSASIDENDKTVTARFLGIVSRRASLLDHRGCVLDADPQPGARVYEPAPARSAAWPAGDATVPQSDWGPGVDAAALQKAVDSAFVGAGDPLRANARGVAVVQGGRLLVAQDAPGFAQGTALHGWSMTKTVAAMMLWKKAQEDGLDLSRPVVDAFKPGRAPAWVAQWRNDDRAKITVADLLYMRDGLANEESYSVTGDVVQMLYGEGDMSGWAADHPTAHPAGTYWNYLSASANILAAVTRGQFATDQEYWDYTKTALLDPIGVNSATLETDTVGTQVGASYLWADIRDWARLGQLMLKDGQWGGTSVLPQGWLAYATTPSQRQGDGQGYGAQTWLIGDPQAGECRGNAGVPADAIAMEGHWGQIVAMVPSRDAVIVRLGWTFDDTQFDECQLVSDVLAALPKA